MKTIYNSRIPKLPEMIASLHEGQLAASKVTTTKSKRSILKGGLVVDPKNKVEGHKDIAFQGQWIIEVADEIIPEKGDAVYQVEGLQVWPGLVDMHLHLGDLFEVSTRPIFEAVADGVTVGLSPGAGNTFMAPALLGAEVDRGVPMNIGVYLGALNVLGSMLSLEELIALFRGTLDEHIALTKMTRNRITYLTAPLIVGIKDHMGHWLSSDEHLDHTFELTSQAGLVFMSHTQDPAHAERLVSLSKNRPLHLAHATAAGCGTHDDPVSGIKRVIELLKMPHVSGEFVTSMLRTGGGNREGLMMPPDAREVALEALSDGIVDILISDGQGDATMKGFGDTRDNVPCILELAESGVLTLSDAVATMTINPVHLLEKCTYQSWWSKELGHLGEGARANIVIVDPRDKSATYTFVNGILAGFENRVGRRANGAGGWVCKFGLLERLGVGDLSAYVVN
jgi:hypothetical protein